MSDISHSRDVVAYKTHKCICGQLILPGTRYHRHRELNQGEWEFYKCHLECQGLHEERMADLDYFIEQAEDQLWEEVPAEACAL
jgi:hypothetical protein